MSNKLVVFLSGLCLGLAACSACAGTCGVDIEFQSPIVVTPQECAPACPPPAAEAPCAPPAPPKPAPKPPAADCAVPKPAPQAEPC